MARVKGAMMTRKRRNKTLKLAKSYWGSKSRHFKMAKQAVYKSGVYAYAHRFRSASRPLPVSGPNRMARQKTRQADFRCEAKFAFQFHAVGEKRWNKRYAKWPGRS